MSGPEAVEAFGVADNGTAPRADVLGERTADAGQLHGTAHMPGGAVQAEEGRWMPLLDAAVALGVSPDTVRRRARRGELPSRHDHGRLMVELAAAMPLAALSAVQGHGEGAGEGGELPLLRQRVELLERERETLSAELEARRQSETELRALLSQAHSLVARIAPPRETVEGGETVERHQGAPTSPARRHWWQRVTVSQ